MILLDTDILIDFFRGQAASRNWFATVSEPLAIPGFVALELYAGCASKRDQSVVRAKLAPFTVLWPSEAAASAIIPIFADGHLTHALGIVDALIAATAVTYQLPLHTFNRKHFTAVPGLHIVQPYVR